MAYKCRNGLWDVVTPLYIADTHMGNIYTGQFFYDDEVVDRPYFEHQAEVYGYDKAAYLEALDRVPRFSRDQVRRLMDFLVKFTDLVSKFTLGNLRSVAFIREQARSAAALRRSEAALRGQPGPGWPWYWTSIPQAVFWKDPGRHLPGLQQTVRTDWRGWMIPSQVQGLTDSDLPWTAEEAQAYRADDRLVLEDSAAPAPDPRIPCARLMARPACWRPRKPPLLDGGGEPFAILGIAKDITEARRGEQERAKLQSQLQHAQKMESLGSLAGGVAHDMNNVLGAILGLASANVDTLPKGNPARQAFETIVKATERGQQDGEEPPEVRQEGHDRRTDRGPEPPPPGGSGHPGADHAGQSPHGCLSWRMTSAPSAAMRVPWATPS